MKAKAKPKKAKSKPAIDRRARFAEEYAVDHNATQAAIRAGYSAKTAKQAGSRLLSRVDVEQKVNTLNTEKAQRTAITADRLMLEYERLALLDPLDLFNADGSMKSLAEMPEDARRAIAGLEIADVRFIGTGETRIESVLKKIKITDKKGALDSLAKIMGLMRDQPQQINIGVSVEVAQEARERLNAKLLG